MKLFQNCFEIVLKLFWRCFDSVSFRCSDSFIQASGLHWGPSMPQMKYLYQLLLWSVT